MKKHVNRILNFLWIAAILFLLIRAALYDGLIVRQYDIHSPLVSEVHTFVLLSDLHATMYGEHQQTLLHTIRRYSPEALFLAGDIADDKRNFEGTAVFLNKAVLEYPCYYVTGNHERWPDYTDDIKALMQSYGVTVLSDGEPLEIGGNIRLFGLDDPLFYTDSAEYRSVLASLRTDEQTFDLLLAHRPEFYEDYLRAGMDLTVCGHTHGGQVRIPFLLNGLYAPNQGYFPDYAGGRYDHGTGQTMIVSRGLMKNDLPRIFNPPEICVLRILPEE